MATQTATVQIILRGDATGATTAIRGTSGALRDLEREGGRATQQVGEFGAGLRYAMTPLVNLFTGMRQAAQGFQSLGAIISAFVTIPLVAFFRRAKQTAVEFDDALATVRKYTGMTEEELGRLNREVGTLGHELVELAKTVATPVVELAELAGMAGSLGVQGVDNIMDFVRVAEIMGVTMDMSAEVALRSLARLSRGMGVAVEESGDFMIKLGNTVNYLEDTTSASATEIVRSMENMISVAATLGQESAPHIAAIAATLIDFGISARQAGTMFDRMAQYVARNSDRLATMLGTTVQEVRQMFDEDFVGSLLNVLQAMSEVESRNERMEIAMELFQQRAGRGAVLLAENMDVLVDNLERAEEQMHSGTSLARDYNAAMESTAKQVAIFENNVDAAAITLGDTFLPMINTAIAWAVPVIQQLVEIFAALPQEIKIAAFAFAIFTAILGPLTFALSTFVFGLAMMFAGLTNVLIALGGMVKFSGIVLPIIIALGSAFFTMADKAEGGASKTGDVMRDAARAAEGWGLGIIGSLAAGMIRGIALVVDAAARVARAIARFFRAASPPEYGPLKKMTVWGQRTIQAFIDGFASADFSIVEDVTRKIADYFKALAGIGRMDEMDVVPAILDVRHAFTELIHIFNETGKVSERVLSGIRDRLGETGERVEEYLRLYLKVHAAQEDYNKASERLEEIRRLREDINATYDQEIRAIEASGKPVIDQMRMVARTTRERDDQLSVLDDEQRLQQRARDEARDKLDQQQELLDTQEKLIDYYQYELDLLEDHADAMGAAAGAASGAAGAAEEWADALAGAGEIDLDPDLEGFGTTLEELLDQIKTIPDEMEHAAAVIESFFAGLRRRAMPEAGEPTPATLPGQIDVDTIPESVTDAYTWGRKLRGAVDEIIGALDSLASSIGGVTEGFDGLVDRDEGLAWFSENEEVVGIIAGIGAAFASWKIIGKLASVFKVIQTFLPLKTLFKAGAITALSKAIGGVIAAIVGIKTTIATAGLPILIGALVAAWVGDLGGFRTYIQETLVPSLKESWQGMKEWAVKSWEDIGDAWEDLRSGIGKAWSWLEENVFEPVGEKYRNAWEDAVDAKDWTLGAWDDMKSGVSSAWSWLEENVFEPVGEKYKNAWEDAQEAKDNIIDAWDDMKGGASKAWNSLVSDVFEPLVEWVQDIWEDAEEMEERVVEAFTGILGDVRRPLSRLKGFVVDNIFNPIAGAIDGVGNAIEGVIDWIGQIDFSDIQVPALFNPNSPTPMEKGLRGITDAMKSMYDQMDMLPELNIEVGGTHQLAFAGAGGGPLVEIDKVIVPNQQVGRQFAKDMAEELSGLTRTRRTGA